MKQKSLITTTPEFIAEVSSNHHQNLARCLQFIDTAAHIGCSAVKFQLFKIEELFAPEILEKSPKHRARKQWELPVSFIPAIKTRCQEKKIKFGCTPFYLKAIEELFPYIDFYKIASYELLWQELLTACAKTGKPVVLSTGMATLDEVRQAVAVLESAGCCEISLLHCVSGYPAPVTECNLSVMETFRKEFGRQTGIRIRFGWSDHTARPSVLFRAVYAWQAEMIEFHLDLDSTGDEFSSGHCWLPEQIKGTIDQIKEGIKADGTGIKEPVGSELKDRDWRADPSDGLRPLKKLRNPDGLLGL